MRPRGPSVAGWIRGARAPLYSMVRICHEARQGASVINQGSVSGGLARFQHAAGWCWVPACAGVTFGYLASSRPDFCFYGHCRTNPGAGFLRDGGWLGTRVVFLLVGLETFGRYYSLQDTRRRVGGVPPRGRGECRGDCEVSFGMLVVSLQRHRRLEPASFDKLRMSKQRPGLASTYGQRRFAIVLCLWRGLLIVALFCFPRFVILRGARNLIHTRETLCCAQGDYHKTLPPQTRCHREDAASKASLLDLIVGGFYNSVSRGEGAQEFRASPQERSPIGPAYSPEH